MIVILDKHNDSCSIHSMLYTGNDAESVSLLCNLFTTVTVSNVILCIYIVISLLAFVRKTRVDSRIQ